jgi:hypothetical protein
VIDIAGEAHEIGLALLLPSYAEVIGVNEVDRAADQGNPEPEQRKKQEVLFLPHEPSVTQLLPKAGKPADRWPVAHAIEK